MGGTLGVIGGTLSGASSAAPYATVSVGQNVTVTANSTAHTKGSWTQIIASTAEAATLLVVTVSGVASAGVNTATLLDIAVGGAGSESAIVSNIPIGGAVGGLGAGYTIPLPVAVASGARISARIQSVVTGGKTATVSIAAVKGGPITPPASLTVIGASTGTSAGTNAGTAWTEITASTAAAYRYLVIVPSLASDTVSSASTAIQLGSGAASSEVEFGSLVVTTTTSEQIHASTGYPAWHQTAIKTGVAAGTRLVVKRATAACDVALIGVA